MKKKILLTWYGITDLKASLMLENTSGPILSALVAEEYDEIIILGYTCKIKSHLTATDFQQELAQLDKKNTNLIFNFIEKHANTLHSHEHFKQWLVTNIGDLELKTKIILLPIVLNHLNDTENIFRAANDALNKVNEIEGNKAISIFISPGTPVMAFVWAFASLKHPHLEKQLIASPQIGKSPEIVNLPSEWYGWSAVSEVNTTLVEESEIDIIFHLFGEQRMPSLLGIQQFKVKHHVFLNSKRYPALSMKPFIKSANFSELVIEPYDPVQIRDAILEFVGDNPNFKSIGFNLTGGTKLMYAGAYAACKILNGIPFYFEINNQTIINIDTFESAKIKPIKNIETFILLNGDGLEISDTGKFDHAEKNKIIEASKIIWEHKEVLASGYKKLKNSEGKNTFEFIYKIFSAKLLKDKSASLVIGNYQFDFDYFPDFHEFMIGKWFEVYIYSLLRPLVQAGKIFDLRMGTKVSIKNPEKNQNIKKFTPLKQKNKDYQEFDILFTDGYSLYVAECKSGSVNSDHIVKISQISNKFGGINAKPILFSAFKPEQGIYKQKADDLKVNWIYSHDIHHKINNLIKG